MRFAIFAALIFAGGTVPSSAQGKGQAGKFDFYVMSLSWSPQHCSEKPGDKEQCGGTRKFGFVLHGLWPQYNKGYPQSCATKEKLDQATAQSMLDIMPSAQLIQHEWRKHGVCDGGTAKEYFGRGRKALTAFRTPARFQQPVQQVMVKPADFKKALLDSNPKLQGNQLAVVCNGRYLQEVRVCLSRDLEGRGCSAQVKDRCSVPEMIVRPVR